MTGTIVTPIFFALALQVIAPNPTQPPPLPTPAPPPAEQPAAAPAPPPGPAQSDEAQYRSCAGLAKAEPERAVTAANDWLVRGGGLLARQCLGLAHSQLGRWAPAASAFEQAARDAEKGGDPRRADFWVQAGNAWLADGNPAKARPAFDAALATTALTPELRGEVHLDRGRALVAMDDLAGARVDFDKALELVPRDPFGWYLSSALALKERRLARAQDEIAKALELAPNEPDLLVHAGNLAGISGEHEAAEGLYMKAIRLAPQSDAAKSARVALAENRQAPTSTEGR